MSIKLEFEGGRDLERALAELTSPYRTKKAARDALRDAAEPIHAAAQAAAPERSSGIKRFHKPGDAKGHPTGIRRRGALKLHVSMGTRLSKRQARLNRPQKMPVEVYVGTRDRIGRLVEFGTRYTGAQPFMRQAWDMFGGQRALRTISKAMWRHIERQARLQARAAQRKARKKG